MTGSAELAQRVAMHHHGHQPADDIEQIGSGSHRTVYLAADGNVYKVGLDAANRTEVATLTAIRERGGDYAPDATLYEVDIDYYGETTTHTIVAMPYLPEDGSVTGERPIFPEAADLNPHGNIHANGGRLWLIDAGGM